MPHIHATCNQFQFTPLREGRRCGAGCGDYFKMFQFTPLREGRRGDSVDIKLIRDVSIHAPA